MAQLLTQIWGQFLALAAPDSTGRQTVIARDGLRVGDYGSQFALSSPRRVALFDDFLGDVVADQWNFVEGTDSSTSDGAISAGINGVFLLTPGDSAGTIVADGAEINGELNWKASQGGLEFEARVKLAAITSVSCFVGLTDTRSLEQAIHSANSANTITTNATDAVGFFFDTNMTDDNWWMAGVANDVDATHQDSGVAPVADTYDVLRVEINTSGVATFYINGKQKGTKMTGALTPTIALCPCVIVRPLSAVAGKTLSIDYIYVSADRV